MRPLRERNPLEAGLVATPWDYRCSSAGDCAVGGGGPAAGGEPLNEALAGEPARRQAHWRHFLLGDDSKEEVVRRDDWVIGGPAFRRRMQRQGRPAPRRHCRPAGARSATPHAVGDN